MGTMIPGEQLQLYPVMFAAIVMGRTGSVGANLQWVQRDIVREIFIGPTAEGLAERHPGAIIIPLTYESDAHD
jgi:hypothetical protein